MASTTVARAAQNVQLLLLVAAYFFTSSIQHTHMQASKKGQLRHWNFQKNHPIWVRTDKEIQFCGDLSVVLTALIAIRKLHQPHVPTGKQANLKILFAPSHFFAASVAKNRHDSKHPSRVLRWLELRSCLVESTVVTAKSLCCSLLSRYK